jgi:uncharacterized membrane protein
MNIFSKILQDVKSALKVNLLAGILFIIPVVATFYFVWLLITWVDKTLLLIPQGYRPEDLMPFPLPGLGFILVFVVLFLSGFFVRNFLGHKLVSLGERIMSYIPLVSKFYTAAKQLVETIFFSSAKDFKRVVLVEYPRKGVFALAYVTGVAVGEIQEKTAQKCINLFLPTTPNPTSGFYLIVPEEDVISLDMSVEDSFKVLISGGILNPDHVRNRNNTASRREDNLLQED